MAEATDFICDPKLVNLHNGAQGIGVKLELIDNEKFKFDSKLRKFRKMVDKSGVLDAYKERQYYTKPSVTKRVKKKKSKYLNNKNV